jgi:hypothetical protein
MTLTHARIGLLEMLLDETMLLQFNNSRFNHAVSPTINLN